MATPDVAPLLPASLPEVTETLSSGVVQKGFSALGGKSVYLYASPLMGRDDRPVGAVVVFLDATYLAAIEWDRWQYNAIRLVVLGVVLSLIAWLLVRFGITAPHGEDGPLDQGAPPRSTGRSPRPAPFGLVRSPWRGR